MTFWYGKILQKVTPLLSVLLVCSVYLSYPNNGSPAHKTRLMSECPLVSGMKTVHSAAQKAFTSMIYYNWHLWWKNNWISTTYGISDWFFFKSFEVFSGEASVQQCNGQVYKIYIKFQKINFCPIFYILFLSYIQLELCKDRPKTWTNHFKQSL